MYMDYEAMWKEQFMPQILESANSKKRRSHVDENDKEYEAGGDNEDNFHKKRRKTIKGRTDASEEPDTVQNVDKYVLILFKFCVSALVISRYLVLYINTIIFFWVIAYL